MSKNLDETVRLQCLKNNKNEYERQERDYKGLQRAQVVLPSGQLISHVVPWEKRVPGNPL